MRNEILILSASASNVYFLGPMGDPDPSNFIHQETNQIHFKQSTVIHPPGAPKLPSETGPNCLRDGETSFVGYPRKGWRLGGL